MSLKGGGNVRGRTGNLLPVAHETLIPLASGQINASDQLEIELVQAIETPTAVLIRWPQAPSVTDPQRLAEVANATMAVLAKARATLARSQAAER